MRPAFALVLLCVAFQSLAAVFGKQAALTLPTDGMSLGVVLANGFYLLSLACLGLQAVAWQLVLRVYPLAWAYQFQSLVYVVILAVSHVGFGESITPGNVVGSVVIVAGVGLACRRA